MEENRKRKLSIRRLVDYRPELEMVTTDIIGRKIREIQRKHERNIVEFAYDHWIDGFYYVVDIEETPQYDSVEKALLSTRFYIKHTLVYCKTEEEASRLAGQFHGGVWYDFSKWKETDFVLALGITAENIDTIKEHLLRRFRDEGCDD